MTAVSFSVFRDKLINGTKCQTIRKPRKNPIKVGTPLRIYWKQRQKKVYEHICVPCGYQKWESKDENVYLCPVCHEPMRWRQTDGSEKLFDSVCTETFLVKMWKEEGIFKIHCPPDLEFEELAKRDGFEDAEKMFEWFDKHYGLSEPQVFQVIRWRRKEAK